MGKLRFKILSKVLIKPGLTNMNIGEIYTLSTNTDHNYTTVITKWSHAYIKRKECFDNLLYTIQTCTTCQSKPYK